MRTFLAFVIVLCIAAGSWLLQGPSFFWPDRFEPSQGVLLDGTASRMLGAALLLIAALGAMVIRQAGYGGGRAAPARWQATYSLLLLIALALVGTAMSLGQPGPNPDWRPRSSGVPVQHIP